MIKTQTTHKQSSKKDLIKKTTKLPVLSIFRASLLLPVKYYKDLIKIGLPLIISFTLLNIIFHYQSINTMGTPTKHALITMLSYIPYLFFLIGLHRIFLMTPHEKQKPFNWIINMLKYCKWTIVMILFLLSAFYIHSKFEITSILIAFIESTLGNDAFIDNSYLLEIKISITLSFLIIIFYVISRCSLVLPASAIDQHRESLNWSWTFSPSSAIAQHGANLNWSWTLSNGNGWRLTLLISILPFLGRFLLDFIPEFESVFYQLFLGSIWFIFTVIEIGLLSLSYAFLVSNAKNNT